MATAEEAAADTPPAALSDGMSPQASQTLVDPGADDDVDDNIPMSSLGLNLKVRLPAAHPPNRPDPNAGPNRRTLRPTCSCRRQSSS